MKNILTIGIHDGHNCGATLAIDGKIVSSFLEERFTRKKIKLGFLLYLLKRFLMNINYLMKILILIFFPLNLCIKLIIYQI